MHTSPEFNDQLNLAFNIGASISCGEFTRAEAVGSLATGLAALCNVDDRGGESRIAELRQKFIVNDSLVSPRDNFFKATFQIAAEGVIDRSIVPDDRRATGTAQALQRLAEGAVQNGASQIGARWLIRKTLIGRIGGADSYDNEGAKLKVIEFDAIMRLGGFATPLDKYMAASRFKSYREEFGRDIVEARAELY